MGTVMLLGGTTVFLRCPLWGCSNGMDMGYSVWLSNQYICSFGHYSLICSTYGFEHITNLSERHALLLQQVMFLTYPIEEIVAVDHHGVA